MAKRKSNKNPKAKADPFTRRCRAAATSREWRIYTAPHGGIRFDDTVMDRIVERGLDLMDAMGAITEVARRLYDGSPRQREYHFRSVTEPNPLDGITVHFLWLDGSTYVSEKQFVPY